VDIKLFLVVTDLVLTKLSGFKLELEVKEVL